MTAKKLDHFKKFAELMVNTPFICENLGLTWDRLRNAKKFNQNKVRFWDYFRTETSQKEKRQDQEE